jgi:hypothetical protein
MAKKTNGESIKENFAAVHRRLLRSDLFRTLGYPAKFLYVCMTDAVFDPGNGYANTSKRWVAYGPTDGSAMGFDKRTFYRAMNQLLDSGTVGLISAGGHGKKAIYDLMQWEYSPLVRSIAGTKSVPMSTE